MQFYLDVRNCFKEELLDESSFIRSARQTGVSPELSQVPEGSWRVSEVSNKRANKTRRVGGQRKMIAPESFAIALIFDGSPVTNRSRTTSKQV